MLRFAISMMLILAIPVTAHADSWRKREYERERSATTVQQRERSSRNIDDATSSRRSQLSAADAARQAQARHGGRVLKVSDAGSQYIVRLLLDDGRVVNEAVRK